MPSEADAVQKARQWNPFEVLLKMRREGPAFKRCCLCLPLRRGLITWGYIKLALNTASIAVLIYILASIKILLILIVIEIALLFIDAVFSIVLIVGGHQKNEDILKAAYIYNIVWLCFLVGSCLWSTYQEIRLALGLMSINIGYETILWVSLPGLCLMFSLIFVQIYLILLIRSEILKLEEQSLEMQFTNPSAAEAQCTMRVPEGGTGVRGQRPDEIE